MLDDASQWRLVGAGWIVAIGVAGWIGLAWSASTMAPFNGLFVLVYGVAFSGIVALGLFWMGRILRPAPVRTSPA